MKSLNENEILFLEFFEILRTFWLMSSEKKNDIY